MELSMRPNTLAESAERIRAGEPYDVVLAEFVDTFLLSNDERARYGTIELEPAALGDVRLDALLGAVAEYLAKQYRLAQVPSWVGEASRRLDEPWFTTSSTDPGMQEYLSFASPAEFRSHNIFTEERPLRRARSHLPFADRGTHTSPPA
jgi:hypothetical protein